jgi:hypothetical protein
MKKFLLLTLTALGLLAVAPNESKAQGFSITFGGGPAYYSGYSYDPGYGYYYYNRPYYYRHYYYGNYYYGDHYRRWHRWHHRHHWHHWHDYD